MFITILAYSINIIVIGGFIFLSIFPCIMIVGPRMGRKGKTPSQIKRARAGEKWVRKSYKRRLDIMFWLE